MTLVHAILAIAVSEARVISKYDIQLAEPELSCYMYSGSAADSHICMLLLRSPT